ncbi:MAG: hypothetical protein QM752_03040 [Gammaproteobacteria bacterium]
MKRLLLIFTLLIASLSAQAQASSSLKDVVDSIQNLQKGMLNWVNATATMYLNLLYEENPSYPITVAANSTVPNAGDKASNKARELSLPQIKEALTRQNEERRKTILALIEASDNPSSTSPATATRKKGKGTAAGDANFDIASLLSPVSYSDDEAKKQALGFVEFITSLVDPVSDINLTLLTDSQRATLQNSAVGRDYIRSVRALVTARSVPVDNLIRIYTERLPQEGLGKEAGMPQADASPLEVNRFIATRRADNVDDWYQTMATASSTTLQRETLNILAEIERQNYQAHLQNEQILATLSVMALQNMKANKTLDQAKEMAAKNLLQSK